MTHLFNLNFALPQFFSLTHSLANNFRKETNKESKKEKNQVNNQVFPEHPRRVLHPRKKSNEKDEESAPCKEKKSLRLPRREGGKAEAEPYLFWFPPILLANQEDAGGGKKMASEVLLDLKRASVSAGTLKEACRTCGERAFHTDVFPARWVNTGLQRRGRVKYER